MNKVSCAIDGLWTEYNDGTWPSCCSGKAFDEREVCLLIVFSCPFSMREQPGMWELIGGTTCIACEQFITGMPMSSDDRTKSTRVHGDFFYCDNSGVGVEIA